MLTNEAKIILDYLIPVFSSGESLIDYSSIANATYLPEFEIETTVKYLEDEGYLKLKRYKNGGFVHSLTHKAFHYKDFEVLSPSSGQTYIFNAPVSNSAIATTGNFTINVNNSFDEIRSEINSRNMESNDKEIALKLIDYIETLTENDAPLKKGFLSKFSDVVSKHSWLLTLTGNALVKYFIG